MRKIVAESSNVPIKTLVSRLLFSYRNISHTQTGKTSPELLFNQKVNTRLSLLKFNRSIVKACVRYFLKIHYTSDLIT